MRRLVTAMNDNAILNVRGAWEAVQHGACAELTDELRSCALAALRGLSTGQQLPGGAQLPMTDEALGALLAKQRDELRGQWESRAVGDEAVRHEYWRELDEALTWEDAAVRERNVALADQQLTEQCKAWLAWLDDGAGAARAGEKATEELARAMQRMPTAPLCRAAKSALEAAGRCVAAQREALGKSQERLAEAERQAAAYGSAAAQQQAAEIARLEEKIASLEHASEKLKQELHQEQASVEARDAELQKAKKQNHSLLEDIEVLRALEHELKAQVRSFAEKEEARQAELERTKAEMSKAETERLSTERTARIARLEADSGSTARQQLEARLEEEVAARKQLQDELERASSERGALQAQFEQKQRAWEAGEGSARKEREAERAELKRAQEACRKVAAELKAKDAEHRGAAAQLQQAQADLEAARAHEREELRRLNRAHAEKEASWRENLDWVKAAAAKAEAEHIASERAARKARWEADTALEERRWLEGEVKRLAQNQR